MTDALTTATSTKAGEQARLRKFLAIEVLEVPDLEYFLRVNVWLPDLSGSNMLSVLEAFKKKYFVDDDGYITIEVTQLGVRVTISRPSLPANESTVVVTGTTVPRTVCLAIKKFIDAQKMPYSTKHLNQFIAKRVCGWKLVDGWYEKPNGVQACMVGDWHPEVCDEDTFTILGYLLKPPFEVCPDYDEEEGFQIYNFDKDEEPQMLGLGQTLSEAVMAFCKNLYEWSMENEEMKLCDKCHGSGLIPKDGPEGTVTCPNCKGTGGSGGVVMPKPESQEWNCDRCGEKVKGHDPRFQTIPRTYNNSYHLCPACAELLKQWLAIPGTNSLPEAETNWVDGGE